MRSKGLWWGLQRDSISSGDALQQITRSPRRLQPPFLDLTSKRVVHPFTHLALHPAPLPSLIHRSARRSSPACSTRLPRAPAPSCTQQDSMADADPCAQTSLGRYLATRLREVGCDHVFAVPGALFLCGWRICGTCGGAGAASKGLCACCVDGLIGGWTQAAASTLSTLKPRSIPQPPSRPTPQPHRIPPPQATSTSRCLMSSMTQRASRCAGEGLGLGVGGWGWGWGFFGLGLGVRA